MAMQVLLYLDVRGGDVALHIVWGQLNPTAQTPTQRLHWPSTFVRDTPTPARKAATRNSPTSPTLRKPNLGPGRGVKGKQKSRPDLSNDPVKQLLTPISATK